MTEKLDAALARLRDAAADPNEFVLVGDKKVRATKYDANHRAERVAKTKDWRKKNPELVKAQNARRQNNDYHHPFVAIDAEGQNFPGHDEVDDKGNVYPLHRTVLWGAAG